MSQATATTGITDLPNILRSIGVDVRKENGKEIVGCCPVHEKRTGKADRSPSWSMNSTNGLWICHSCGARGNLPILVSEVTGETDAIMAVHNLIINAGLNQLQNPVFDNTPAQPVDWLTFSAFEKPPADELTNRRLTKEASDEYGLRWNTSKQAWVLPIVSPLGELWGWQEKGTDYVRNYPVGITKSHTLFGIERFKSSTVVLVESPLDVVRFASSFSGMQCLSSFGVNVSTQQLHLLASVANKLIVALDNDVAGLVKSKELFKIMPLFRKGVYWFDYNGTDAKDIGEMTDSEIEVALSASSVIPWWVQ